MSDKAVILIVEDKPNWQDTLQRLLGVDKYEIVIAGSLRAAVALLRSRIIDVAIVDIKLEEGDTTNTDGMAFLDEMEKYYPEDRTHAIMLSGVATEQLAIDALTRPSQMVLNFFLKEELDEEHLIREVARAVRATEAERVMRADIPRFLLEVIGVSDLAACLAAETDTATATKDLRLLLRNLLLNTLPLAPEIRVNTEPLASIAGSASHILCWSRKLVMALEISIGRKGVLESLQPGAFWQKVSAAEKISHWSTRYFDGILFKLPDVSFEQFLSSVASIS